MTSRGGYGLASRPAPLPLPPADAPLRVVLDTNAVLSLWHYRHPRLVGLLAWLERRRAALLTREATLDELARVLRLPDLALTEHRQAELLADYRARSTPFAEPDPALRDAALALPQCRDRDDQKFLALAWEAEAHLLLTRDKRVLAMATRAPWRDRTLIVTPERLLRHVDLAAATARDMAAVGGDAIGEGRLLTTSASAPHTFGLPPRRP